MLAVSLNLFKVVLLSCITTWRPQANPSVCITVLMGRVSINFLLPLLDHKLLRKDMNWNTVLWLVWGYFEWLRLKLISGSNRCSYEKLSIQFLQLIAIEILVIYIWVISEWRGGYSVYTVTVNRLNLSRGVWFATRNEITMTPMLSGSVYGL